MSKVKCEILEVSPERIKFILSNCDVSFANSLRRVMIAQVPTIAPFLITVFQNTSVLHDQFLGQRIGLIPFYSQSQDKLKFPWQCPCQKMGERATCPSCNIPFRLQAHHRDTGQFNQPVRQVTSLDIQPMSMIDQSQYQSGKRPVMPVKFLSGTNKKKQVGIPIVKLSHNQQINLHVICQRGFGKMHAKWSPVSLATFQPECQIKINHDIHTTYQEKIQIRDSCPAKVFEVHNDVLEAVYPEKCIFCGQCQKKAQSISMARLKNYIKINKKKDKFIFTVQSVGSLPAATIVKKAMSVLREKLQQIRQLIKNEDQS